MFQSYGKTLKKQHPVYQIESTEKTSRSFTSMRLPQKWKPSVLLGSGRRSME